MPWLLITRVAVKAAFLLSLYGMPWAHCHRMLAQLQLLQCAKTVL